MNYGIVSLPGMELEYLLTVVEKLILPAAERRQQFI